MGMSRDCLATNSRLSRDCLATVSRLFRALQRQRVSSSNYLRPDLGACFQVTGNFFRLRRPANVILRYGGVARPERDRQWNPAWIISGWIRVRFFRLRLRFFRLT